MRVAQSDGKKTNINIYVRKACFTHPNNIFEGGWQLDIQQIIARKKQ